MSDASCRDTTVNGYTIRRLGPADAPGVARLVELVYGDSYYPSDLYDPARVLALNEGDKLVSVVALDQTGDVIGREGGRTVLAVTVDDWLMDELATVGADEWEEELAA